MAKKGRPRRLGVLFRGVSWIIASTSQPPYRGQEAVLKLTVSPLPGTGPVGCVVVHFSEGQGMGIPRPAGSPRLPGEASRQPTAALAPQAAKHPPHRRQG